MPKLSKYPAELKERAVRPVLAARDEDGGPYLSEGSGEALTVIRPGSCQISAPRPAGVRR